MSSPTSPALAATTPTSAISTANASNTAIKRIMREYLEFQRSPSSHFSAAPLEDNLFEWHFTIRGADDSDYAGGRYHGRILLPSQYPFKPPDIMLLTPSGRFQCSTKICLSISSFHAETWQPSWSIRTVLTALIAFFTTPAAGAIGSLDYPSSERRTLANKSRNWTCAEGSCPVAGEKLVDVLPEVANAEPAPKPEAGITFKAPASTSAATSSTTASALSSPASAATASSSAIVSPIATQPTSQSAAVQPIALPSAQPQPAPTSYQQDPSSPVAGFGLHQRHAAPPPRTLVESALAQPSNTFSSATDASAALPSVTSRTDAVLAASVPAAPAPSAATARRKRELTDEEYSLIAVVTVMLIVAILLRKLLGRTVYGSDPFYFDFETLF